jgi:hypothetical protein
MFTKTLVAFAVCSTVLSFSCTESPNSPGKTHSQGVTADLQKLANTVDNLGMLNNTKKQNQPLQKVKELDDFSCNSLGTGIEVCTYSFDGETGIDTTYTYGMDGIALKDWADIDGSYKQTVKSHYSSTKYKGVALFNSIFEKPDASAETLFIDFKMTVNGTAMIDYYNDDLVLNFSKVACTIENMRTSYDYLFTMYDGKYSVKMIGDYTCKINDEPADTAIVASGPITLVSTGEKAGTFNLFYSGDVQILDCDGKVIKKTN